MAGAPPAEEYEQRIGEPEAVVARQASLVESQRQMIESRHEAIARLERSSPAHATSEKCSVCSVGAPADPSSNPGGDDPGREATSPG
ncbi:MAG: hypothetical protein M3121_02335 [Chloroflexota bacterium]|nr:hypothetical protein [Chloroflexota bacterium]